MRRRILTAALALSGLVLMGVSPWLDQDAFATTDVDRFEIGESTLLADAEAIAEQSALQAEQVATALEELRTMVEATAAEREVLGTSNQWVLPVVGYRITGRFGVRNGLWTSGHSGLDFAAPAGTPLVAMAAGRVTFTGHRGNCGLMTTFALDDGVTELKYCHQSAVAVQAGDTVRPGQPVGLVGSTGRSTGPHLHLEVKVNGVLVDPEAALAAHGVTP